MAGTPRSELVAELEHCARLCEETARRCVEQDGDGVSAEVVSSFLLAAAAFDTAAKLVQHDDATTALLIAATLATDAAAAAERRGLDEHLVGCLVALRRVAALCEREVDAA